jgi:hypothetical protein
MLGTGARYAEYGITGGFFLFTQALFLGLTHPDMLVWGADNLGVLLSASLNKIPPLAQPGIQSLLVALALLSVFIIGLVLEIIGSVFMLWEARTFRKYLAMNEWIAKFFEAELPHYAEEYGLFLDLADQIGPFGFRKGFLSQLKKGPSEGFRWQRQVHQRFRRLESVLLAKALTSGAKTEMLAEQISICRMSRAIATALYVVSLELAFMPSWNLEAQGATLTLYWFLIVILIIASSLITSGAYSRFANTLFSLVYASSKPQTFR